jgi:hypothetical protein
MVTARSHRRQSHLRPSPAEPPPCRGRSVAPRHIFSTSNSSRTPRTSSEIGISGGGGILLFLFSVRYWNNQWLWPAAAGPRAGRGGGGRGHRGVFDGELEAVERTRRFWPAAVATAGSSCPAYSAMLRGRRRMKGKWDRWLELWKDKEQYCKTKKREAVTSSAPDLLCSC